MCSGAGVARILLETLTRCVNENFKARSRMAVLARPSRTMAEITARKMPRSRHAAHTSTCFHCTRTWGHCEKFTMQQFVPLTDELLYATSGLPGRLVPYRVGMPCGRATPARAVSSGVACSEIAQCETVILSPAF